MYENYLICECSHVKIIKGLRENEKSLIVSSSSNVHNWLFIKSQIREGHQQDLLWKITLAVQPINQLEFHQLESLFLRHHDHIASIYCTSKTC
jgi:hypothetical protein